MWCGKRGSVVPHLPGVCRREARHLLSCRSSAGQRHVRAWAGLQVSAHFALRVFRVGSSGVPAGDTHSAYVRRRTRGAARRPGDTIELEAAQAHEAADVQVAWPIRLRGGGAAPEDTLLLCPRGADAALVFRRGGGLGVLQAAEHLTDSSHPCRAHVQHCCVLFEGVWGSHSLPRHCQRMPSASPGELPSGCRSSNAPAPRRAARPRCWAT
jgi:hypothetical protein